MKLIVFKTIILLGVLITPLILNTINQFQNDTIFCECNSEMDDKNENEVEFFIITPQPEIHLSISKNITFQKQVQQFTSIYKEIVLPPPKSV